MCLLTGKGIRWVPAKWVKPYLKTQPVLSPEAERWRSHGIRIHLDPLLQHLTADQCSDFFPRLLEIAGAGWIPGPRVSVTSTDALPPFPSQIVNQTENACPMHGYACKQWVQVHCIKCNLKSWQQIRQEKKSNLGSKEKAEI